MILIIVEATRAKTRTNSFLPTASGFAIEVEKVVEVAAGAGDIIEFVQFDDGNAVGSVTVVPLAVF